MLGARIPCMVRGSLSAVTAFSSSARGVLLHRIHSSTRRNSNGVPFESQTLFPLQLRRARPWVFKKNHRIGSPLGA